MPAGLNDLILSIDYTGDTGMGFLDSELVADEFYKGLPWEIGLRKFMTPTARAKEMVLYFRPMSRNATYLLDLQPYPQSIPAFGEARTYLKLNNISLKPQYKTVVNF